MANATPRTSSEDGILLHHGKWGNADVWHRTVDGRDSVVKDFRKKSWIIRTFYGRWQTWREYHVLRRLEPLGVVPCHNRRITPCALVQDYVPGLCLHDLQSNHAFRGNLTDGLHEWVNDYPKFIRSGDTLGEKFFPALEEAIRAVHKAGFVHLDLHNARNIMRTMDDRPCLIDWQSAVPAFLFPGFIRRALERIDMSGLYKHWDHFLPGSLTPERQKTLDWMHRWRKFWVLRGYMFSQPHFHTPHKRHTT